MLHLLEHQFRGRLDVDLFEGHTEGVSKPNGVVLRAFARRETRQREREDVAAGPAFSIHRARGDDQRVRRVQAAGQPEHHLRVVQRTQPLLQTGDLDVVRLIAILLQPCGIRRHEGEALHLAEQADVSGGGSSANSTRRNESSVMP